MGVVTGTIANGAALAANGAVVLSNDAALPDPVTTAAALPAWVLWLGVAAAVALWLIAIGVLLALRPKPAPAPPKHKPFVKMVKAGVERHTETIVTRLADRLREAPKDFTEAQGFVRDLRWLVRAPLNFVEHLERSSPGEWPDVALAAAFHDWAAPIRAIDGLLGDMYDELRIAADQHKIGSLIAQYEREEWFVRREVGALSDLAKAVYKAAKPYEKDEKKGHGAGDAYGDDDHDHH